MVVFDDMTDIEYHSRPELSSTGARRLLDSPARYRYWADHQEPTRAVFDLGTAAHTKILGTGAGTIIYPEQHLTPSGNVSTKAATVEWEKEQRNAGLIPISRFDAGRVDAMAEAVLADRGAREKLEAYTAREVTVVTEVEGVAVRARFDLYDGVSAADLKTVRDASPAGFNRAVGSYGYHIQGRWYDDAHLAETGRRLDNFWFIVVESTRPHLVGVYDLDFVWDELAGKKTAKARDLYRECIASGEWPAYGSATLTAPTWAVYEGEDEEMKI